MMQLSNSLPNKPVLSLRTNGRVATTLEAIINPNNLKIEGLFCQDNFSKDKLVLLSQDIREQSANGFIINDHEVLTDPADLVRLQKVLALNFSLLNMPVFSTAKRRLGKIIDYSFDGQTMYVQKIYVGQNMLKSFKGGQLSIDRNQIVEITATKIIVNDPLQGDKIALRGTATAN